ncbi:hypothetical protein ACFL35_14195 [Candidatus Riflebacteria bacterium]
MVNNKFVFVFIFLFIVTPLFSADTNSTKGKSIKERYNTVLKGPDGIVLVYLFNRHKAAKSYITDIMAMAFALAELKHLKRTKKLDALVSKLVRSQGSTSGSANSTYDYSKTVTDLRPDGNIMARAYMEGPPKQVIARVRRDSSGQLIEEEWDETTKTFKKVNKGSFVDERGWIAFGSDSYINSRGEHMVKENGKWEKK